jgi:hypothetical protein
LQSVSKIFSSSLKEIENQPKTFENFWLGIIRLVTLHSLKKGEETTEKAVVTLSEAKGERSLKVGKQQQPRFYIGTIGKSSEINSI